MKNLVLALGVFGLAACSNTSGPAAFSALTWISAGAYYTCGVRDSEGWCWGFNGWGMMGNGEASSESNYYLPIQPTSLGSPVTKIQASQYLTCAIVSSALKCWGGATGGIGHYPGSDGSTTSSLTPVQVQGMADQVTDVSVGMSMACAIRAGALSCWGGSVVGLGDGSTTDSKVPVVVAASGASQVSVGEDFVCYLTTAGGVKCWGGNSGGQLGNGSTSTQTTPMDVTGATSGITKISAGGSHACAITSSGGALCWGLNQYGALGDGTLNNGLGAALVPTLTSGVTDISAGYRHTCALVSGGAQCWGLNESGQIGDGSLTMRVSPTAVAGLTSGVAAVSAGGHHSCVYLGDATARCWGLGGSGELAIGTNIQGDGEKRFLTPQTVLSP